MTGTKELALKTLREKFGGAPMDTRYVDEHLDFATLLIDAYTAEQEPVFEVGFGWLKTKQGNVTPCPKGTLLFTAPPLPEPEPAPKEAGFHDVDEFYKESAVCAAPSSEEVREMVERLRMWNRDGGSLTARGAADLIERLAKQVQDANNEWVMLHAEIYTLKHNPAARVPDGCVVVPK